MADITHPGRVAAGLVSAAASAMSRRPVIDRVVWRVVFGTAIVLSAVWITGFYASEGGRYLFLDAHIYYRATASWLQGGNPWTMSYEGVRFGGIPPTLLLNVPFIPFGEHLAVGFWVVANSLALAFLIRRLRLPIWVLLLQPVIEGWLAANPDLALAGMIAAGAGWLAVLTKPYSAPALIGERRWLQLSVAVGVGLATVPVLPWRLFYDSRDIVAESFANFAGNPVSAAGDPLLMVIVALGLVSIGWRRGWALFTPGLLAQQPHYVVFSLATVVRSRILALAMTIPIIHAAAIGVIAYAALERWRSRAAAPAAVVQSESA